MSIPNHKSQLSFFKQNLARKPVRTDLAFFTMTLSLQGLCPGYLSSAAQNSGIWGHELLFEPGERVFVRAPSGRGKTSLIHLLYGLRTDAAGAVLWDKTNILEADSGTLAALRARDVSIVFQDLRLFPQLTLWENLLVKKALGSLVEVTELNDWLERLGLAHRRDQPAGKLSYGEQQRTAILRALLPEFKWLLLDEPFSHLDAENARKALDLIAEVADRHGAGIFYAELDENTYFRATQTFLL